MKTLDGKEILGETNINGQRRFITKNENGSVEEIFSSLVTPLVKYKKHFEIRKRLIKPNNLQERLSSLEDRIKALEGKK